MPFAGEVRGVSTPVVPIRILLVNPNSTVSMTDACLATVQDYLPSHCTVLGFTAPSPAPTAIESMTDAIRSTAACVPELARASEISTCDAVLVACYSKHPLIDVLREMLNVPVIGIMEASLYAARMLGGRFGIVATGERSKVLQQDAVAAYGLSHFYVGSEATKLRVLELEARPRSEVLEMVGKAAKDLLARGADTICLGCAGMTDMVEACETAVTEDTLAGNVIVIDGVVVGVQLLLGLVRSRLTTAKRGVYGLPPTEYKM